MLDYVSSRAIANLIGFFVIFFGVLILGAIVGRILAKFFKWVGLIVAGPRCWAGPLVWCEAWSSPPAW